MQVSGEHESPEGTGDLPHLNGTRPASEGLLSCVVTGQNPRRQMILKNCSQRCSSSDKYPQKIFFFLLIYCRMKPGCGAIRGEGL